MSADLDIESYLEQQVEKNAASKEKVNDKSRSRSPDRRRDSARDRDRDRGSDRDRDRNREKDHDRDRDRDRGSDRDRDRDRRGSDRERARRSSSRDRGDRDRDREKERERRPIKDDTEIQAERELARKKREIDDLTKDQRTILVGQLTSKATESDLRNFFSQIGKVNSVIMIRDKHTGRHKGIGYVEMADLDVVPNCLLFNNVVPDFQKFAILVKPSEAEKNFAAKKEPVATSSISSDPDTRLYLGKCKLLLPRTYYPIRCFAIYTDY